MRSLSTRYQPLVLLLLALCGWTLWGVRRQFIRSWFVAGPRRSLPARLPPSSPAGPLRPLRIVLIDGLSEEVARTLPAHSSVCAAGLTLHVDVGFPSVSLPAQHVLWTGASQQHSGIQFAVEQLKSPAFESLPGQIARRGRQAIALADRHPEIVRSFPFSSFIVPDSPATSLSPPVLRPQMLRAARSPAALVFVHLVGVDQAGHRGGAADPRYYAAAREADALLEALWQARQPDWTVAVLSDHGHLRSTSGGHGDSELEVRWVRACLAGPRIPRGVHAEAALVDLTTLFAEELQLPAPHEAEGRSLAALLAAPTRVLLPPPSWSLTATGTCGLLLALALLWVNQRVAQPARLERWRARVLLLPWGVLVTLVLVTSFGTPSLSRSYVYPAWPWLLLGASLPAFALPALQLWTLERLGLAGPRVLLGLAAGVLALPVAGLALTDWPLAKPPLVPYLSAWAATLLAIAAPSLLALGLAPPLLERLRATRRERPSAALGQPIDGDQALRG